MFKNAGFETEFHEPRSKTCQGQIFGTRAWIQGRSLSYWLELSVSNSDSRWRFCKPWRL